MGEAGEEGRGKGGAIYLIKMLLTGAVSFLLSDTEIRNSPLCKKS